MSKHVFVSYSRKDTAFVNRLVEDLKRAGIQVWLDTDDLVPGTPDWDEAIRQAVRDAAVVLLIASPDSRTSPYVQGELTIARALDRHIYAVWARGEEWIDCVPLFLAHAQYVDCRDDTYGLNIANLINGLQRWIEPENSVTIIFPLHETIEFDLSRFPTFRVLLDNIYIIGLRNWFGVVTYGQDWVLGNVFNKTILVPWVWVRDGNWNTSTSRNYKEWGTEAPAKYGVQPNSRWGVWDLDHLMVSAFLFNDTRIAVRLASEDSVQEAYELYRANRFLDANEDIDAHNYRYHIFLATNAVSWHKRIFVEA